MLAKGPPNFLSDCTRSFPSSQRFLRRGINGGSSPFSGFLSSSDGQCRRIAVRAGNYSRIPMETPGAYLLVDEETGERVIVWGGADDGPDSPLPSKEVLTWKPAGEREKTLGTGRRNLGTAGSFGKLKALKVKALSKIKKMPAYESTLHISDDDDDEDDEDDDDDGISVRMEKGNEKFRRQGMKKDKVLSRGKKMPTYESNLHVSDDDEDYGDSDDDEDDAEGISVRMRKGNEMIRRKGVQKVQALSRSKKMPTYESSLRVSDDDDDDDYNDDDDDERISMRMKKGNGLIRRKGMQSPRMNMNNDGSDVSDEEDDERAPKSRFLDVLQRGEHANDDNRADVASPVNGWKNVEPATAWKASVQSDVRLKKKDNDSRFFSRKSFKELGCSDEMVECLRKQQFHRPSHIQAMTYSLLLEGRSCIISDQSGSGKTLAYLAPTIQRMRQEEIQGLSKSSSRSPRVLILVPTAELATQVLANCRSISRSGFPFRSMVVTGGFRQKTQLESLEQDLDVLIATPGRFIYLFQEGFLKLNNLKCAVLDEVDILFGDEAFEQVLKTLIVSAPVMTQYLFVTATLPADIYNKLVEDFPDSEVVAGPGMHRVSYGLEEVLVDCSGSDDQEKNPETAFSNKKSSLLQLVEQSPVRKTVIFCNKIETCRKVENVLKRFDRREERMRVLSFHAALDQDSRLSNMKEFMSTRSNGSLFLVCTDRASRGIDFSGVDHVVLFDFPRDPSEYIRRVGRTARGAGGKGKAFAFVVGKQVALARRIMDRNIKGHPVHDLPST